MVRHTPRAIGEKKEMDELVVSQRFTRIRRLVPILDGVEAANDLGRETGFLRDFPHGGGLVRLAAIAFDQPLGDLPARWLTDRNERHFRATRPGPKNQPSR